MPIGHDLVPVGVERGDHAAGRDDRDAVLAAAPAVDDGDPDACHHAPTLPGRSGQRSRSWSSATSATRPSCAGSATRKQTASTAAVIGTSTTVRCARSSTDRHDLTPSATWPCVAACACSSVSPRPSRSPKRAVARQRRGAGGDEVAEPGEAGERQRVGAERRAQPGGLGQPAGDERRDGVVAEAHALRDAARERDDVLHRAAELAADDVGVRVRAEVGRRAAPAAPPSRVSSSMQATTVAVGCSLGDLEGEVRPGHDRDRARPAASATSAITSLIRLVVPSSTPFIRLTSVASRRQQADPARAGSRAAICDGMAIATSSAPSQRGRRVVRGAQPGRQVDVGQVVGVGVLAVDRARRARRGAPTA